jgi:hypothetical protein
MSDINIRLTSADLSNSLLSALKPTSLTVHFGVNSVPYAELSINPVADGVEGKTFIQSCDFDHNYRRKQLSVIVSAHVEAGGMNSRVCLRFDGVIDGLSFSQSPGNLSTQLVIKSKMQWLTEIAPKIIGLHPSSIDIFQIPTVLNWQRDPGTGNVLLQNTLSGAGVTGQLDSTKNIIDWYLSLLRAAITSQQNAVTTLAENSSEYLALGQVLKSQDIFKDGNLASIVLEQLDSIDTSAVQNLPVKAGASFMTGLLADSLVSMRDSVFANLIRFVSEMGCILVVGNSRSFIVPEAAYLTVPKPSVPALRQASRIPNIAFPAEYENFAFNDNGYVNLKGVYVIHDQNTNQYATTTVNNTDFGVYIDPDPTSKGNIQFTHIPQLASLGFVSSTLAGGQGVQQLLGTGSALLNQQVSADDVTSAVDAFSAQNLADQQIVRAFMDKWAQMAYCKMKYDDRVGSFSTVYKNSWTPGSMGSLYTRLPGIYCDFFVTSVTHHFQLNPPSSGVISTTVSFKGGRLGPNVNTGLDKIDLYAYGWNEAQAFCGNFLADITV